MNRHDHLQERPAPTLPSLQGLVACYDPLPLVASARQPDPAVRPIYWWARQLADHGAVLRVMSYSPQNSEAAVAVQLPSYQVVEIRRGSTDELLDPVDLPHVLAEAIWRLGVTGWGKEIADLVSRLRGAGLLIPRRSVPRCADHIPGFVHQPPRRVRVLYWWAQTLRNYGWVLHEVGQPVAAGGFVAQIPGEQGESALVVYPHGMDDDGTAASALANALGRARHDERRCLRRLIEEISA